VTLPGRGYRFAAPVRTVALESEDVVVHRRVRAQIVVEQREPEPNASATAGGLPEAPRRVLVAALRGGDAEPMLVGALSAALRIALSQSPRFVVVEQPAHADALADTLVVGSLSQASGHYVFRLDAFDLGSEALLASAEAAADGTDDLLEAVGRAAETLRGRLGEPAASIERLAAPIAPAGTRSLAALRAFADGEAQRARGVDADAAPSYQLAIDLDPDFAIAYARLGRIYLNAQQHEAGQRLMAKAYELRRNASERDRLYIAAHHYAGRGELDRALQAYVLWRDLYPNEVVPANNLVETYLSWGDPAKAARSARAAAALAPDNAIVLATLVRGLRRNGEWAVAKEVYADLVARGLDGHVTAHLERMQIAVIEHDDAEIESQIARAIGTTNEAEILNMAAVIATSRGQGRAARALLERATRAAARSGLGELQAVCLREYAEYAAAVGETGLARAHIQRVLAEPASPVALGSGASVYAVLGEVDRARQLIDEATRRFPSHFGLQRMVLPMARAIAHLKEGAAQAALRELQAIEPFDLSMQLELESIYWRGAAWLDAGRPVEAATQFRKLLRHWTFRPDSHLIALARVGLARAHAAQGERDLARAEYETFFSGWADADADTPLLVAARAEVVRLQ